MNLKKIIFCSLGVVLLGFTSCEKLPLQRATEYKTSFFQNDLNMSVMDFMKSRPDLFTGLLEAIEYVNEDPAFADVKAMYSTTGNTFFLPWDDALTNVGNANAYWSVVENRVTDNEPGSPTQGLLVRASSWRQYPRAKVALLLRYHVVKGYRDFKGITSVPTWYETFAFSTENPAAKVNIYINPTRDGQYYMNNYSGTPFVNAVPRTPNLIATNGVVHVLNNYLRMPTLADLAK